MASGKLGSANLSAVTNTLIYTVPSNKVATANINICNRSTIEVNVRIAIGSGGSPANTDYIEYDFPLPAQGVLERTGIVCSAGEKIWCYADSADVSVRVHGFEENA